jgi:hypothetical protein
LFGGEGLLPAPELHHPVSVSPVSPAVSHCSIHAKNILPPFLLN